jgi:transcriptional regulator with XRE-family HTH domain
MDIFCTRLKAQREHLGWNQSELARRSGVPSQVISRLESGARAGLTLDVARRLARALGVGLDALAGTLDDAAEPVAEAATRRRGHQRMEGRTMAQALDQATVGLAQILDPVVACFTREVAQRVASLQAAPEVQARLDALAEKCNEGLLTPEETAEYDAYIRAMDMVAVLQQQARALLAQPSPV